MSTIETLRDKIHQYETANAATQAVLPFGVPKIDAALPDGGLKLGALHEVAGGGNGSMHGAAAVLFAAGILARTSGHVLWCVRQRDLFAPALAQSGLPMERILFVESGDEKTLLACFEEGLRHGGMGGVVGEVSKMNMTASRRLQLAAESTGAIGVAVWRWRNDVNAQDWVGGTAAHTCWRVKALPSVPLPVPGIGRARWRLELMRCRAGERAQFEVEACDEKGHIALSAQLADRPGAAADGERSAVA